MHMRFRIFFLSLIVSLSSANCFANKLLSSIVEDAFQVQGELLTEELLSSGVWSKDRKALLIHKKEGTNSLLYVFIEQGSNRFLTIDLSDMVNSKSNAKLGRDRDYYDRYEQEALLYEKWGAYLIGVAVRTTAWKDGQRYTVQNKPTLIKENGEKFKP